jgi:membrane fusion protein, copper/silver efflux system
MSPQKILVLIAALSVLGSALNSASFCQEPKTSPGSESAQKKPLYFCPMHPAITSDHPGQCPICHMDLEKAEDSDFQGSNKAGLQAPQAAVSGRATLNLPPETQQFSGIKTETVSKRPMTHTIRAFGQVAYDAEAFTALREFQLARQNASTLNSSTSSSLKRGADNLLSAAELKLKLMGLDDESLKQAAFDPEGFLLPADGVWVNADLYENEIGLVRKGTEVTISAPAFPARTFDGQVVSIAPVLNPATRTFKVRVKVKDPDKLLKPIMAVDALVKIDLGDRLAVPIEAVLAAGDEDLVFVVKDQVRFEPRQVKLGLRGGGFYQVLEGLDPDERVVTQANFLVDSESRLRATLAKAEGQSQENHPPEHRH